LENAGAAPTVMNAANEVAVAQFLEGQLGFGCIAALVEATLEAAEKRGWTRDLTSIEEALSIDREARALAHELLPEIAAKSS
jgi:1-deoxy-D-xylulose-5-phosphate reductoisomerase